MSAREVPTLSPPNRSQLSGLFSTRSSPLLGSPLQWATGRYSPTEYLPTPFLEELARPADQAPLPRSWSPSWCTTGNGGAPWCVPCESIFAAGANASEASDHLFLHRNSMLYRLARRAADQSRLKRSY